MSHKSETLRKITEQVAGLLDQGSVDSLRIEVICGGRRMVIVSDSNMLSVGELGRITGTYRKPTLTLV